ncbi:tyrosine-type recombinase/integrase [Kitasatospora sp. NPDC085879]|uniref:tyrosine-type recombinase/integrase n=1 Tax=Kitasatospora sp. NPDC085879 TaxID=3154769 RepID=UPI0034194FF1
MKPARVSLAISVRPHSGDPRWLHLPPPDGHPLHPEYALNHVHHLCREFGVSRTTIHNLRHLAATISITAGVLPAVVSKTLRHSTRSTTANIYGHLTTQAARDALTPSTAPSPPPTRRQPLSGCPARIHRAPTLSEATSNPWGTMTVCRRQADGCSIRPEDLPQICDITMHTGS